MLFLCLFFFGAVQSGTNTYTNYVLVPLQEGFSSSVMNYSEFTKNKILLTDGEFLAFTEPELINILKQDTLAYSDQNILIDPAYIDPFTMDENKNYIRNFTGGLFHLFLLDNIQILKINKTLFAMSKVTYEAKYYALDLSLLFRDKEKKNVRVFRKLIGVDSIENEYINSNIIGYKYQLEDF